MTRYVNVNLDRVVRLELADDDPLFTTGRAGTDEDAMDYLDAEASVIEEAERVLSDAFTQTGEARQNAIAKIVFADASVEDVTDALR